MIPRVMHFIWMQGADAMPADYRRCYESWAPEHPGWAIRLWSRDDLFWLHNAWVWDDGVRPIVQADVARFEIVLRYGGVYLDCDQECLHPIDGLVGDVGAFVSRRDDRNLESAGFGATHGHPWLLDVVEEIDRYSGAIRDGLDIDRPLRRATARHPELLVLEPAVLHGELGEGDLNLMSYANHRRFSNWRGPHASRT